MFIFIFVFFTFNVHLLNLRGEIVHSNEDRIENVSLMDDQINSDANILVYDVINDKEIVEAYSLDEQFTEPFIIPPFEGLAPSSNDTINECNLNTFTGKLESIIGDDDRVRVNPTTSFPWRTICKLYMTWGALTWAGTGAIVDENHVLTAAHNVYWPSNGGWADSVKIIPGMNDGSEPFGHVWATTMRVYSEWKDTQNHNHDFALLTLDSDIGLQTGWMGRYTTFSTHPYYTSGLNTAGYPGDLDGGLNMYWNYNSGRTANDFNHWFYLDSAPGQSGSPVWIFDGTNRYILTVHTNGDDGSGSNHGTRLDQNKFDIINNWIYNDQTSIDKPDLADRAYIFSDFTPTTVGAGVTVFDVWCDIQNIGTIPSGTFTVSYYASTDYYFTKSDYFIGNDTVSSINPTYSASSSWSGMFPSDIPSGSYYIGWIIDPDNEIDEFNEDNNDSLENLYKLLVDAIPPSNPITCIQTNGTTDNNTWQETVDDPAFTWSGASDSQTGVAGYYYYWGTDPNGTSSAFTTSNGYDPPKVDIGAYYLRVMTKDGVGHNASWSTLYIFKFDNSADEDPPISERPDDGNDDDDDDNNGAPQLEIIELIIVAAIAAFASAILIFLFVIRKNNSKREFTFEPLERDYDIPYGLEVSDLFLNDDDDDFFFE